MKILETLPKEGSLDIRWHGRGGQGAKTAALLLAEAVVGAGKYVQAFPEYGPERMGAPVQAYNRVSDRPIAIHSGITNPAIVVVLDPSLTEVVDVTHGLKEEGILLINSKREAKEFRRLLSLIGRQIFTVDASAIALRCLGQNIPNTPLLGALIKVTGIISLEQLLNDTRSKLEKKFRHKPEMVEGNLNAISQAFTEVRGE